MKPVPLLPDNIAIFPLASCKTLHDTCPESVGVPLGTLRRLIVSPAKKATLLEVSDNVVSVSDIVTVKAVALPFFITVNAHDFPDDGAVCSHTVRLLAVKS